MPETNSPLGEPTGSPNLRERFCLQYYADLHQALGKREGDSLRFLAYLLTGLGGALSLYLYGSPKDKFGPLEDEALPLFVVGFTTVISLFFVGTWHLGQMTFNYRSLAKQLRKLEQEMGVKDVIIKSWQADNRWAFYIPGLIRPQFYTLFSLGWVVAIVAAATVAPDLSWLRGNLPQDDLACFFLLWAMAGTFLLFALRLHTEICLSRADEERHKKQVWRRLLSVGVGVVMITGFLLGWRNGARQALVVFTLAALLVSLAATITLLSRWLGNLRDRTPERAEPGPGAKKEVENA